MAALGPLRRVLQGGMICGALASIPWGALAAGSPEAAPPGNPPGEEAVAEQGNLGSSRETKVEGDVFLSPTPAEVRTIIQRTLSAVDLQILVGDAAGGAVLEGDTRVRELAAELGLRDEALARLFEILGRQDVPSERLADVLAEIVARHKILLARVRLLEAPDPRAAELRDAVAAAMETAEYERVDALLAEAEAIESEALRQLLEALDQRAVNAAAIYPEAGVGIQFEHRAAEQGALLHGAGRAVLESLPQFLSSSRFCQWHPQNRFCQRWAEASPLCDRLPNHPLCDDDRFCNKRRGHPLCADDPPPSSS